MFSKLVLITATALVTIATTAALTCYDCNEGRADTFNSCHDPLNKTLNPILKEETCSNDHDSCVFIQREFNVERRCVKNLLGDVDYCTRKENEKSGEIQKCKLCFDHLCNSEKTGGAAQMTVSLGVLAVVAAVIYSNY